MGFELFLAFVGMACIIFFFITMNIDSKAMNKFAVYSSYSDTHYDQARKTNLRKQLDSLNEQKDELEKNIRIETVKNTNMNIWLGKGH